MVEILARLPHAGSAIRCAAVCKSWKSLVSSSQLIQRLTHHDYYSDDPSFSQPYTLLFKFERSISTRLTCGFPDPEGLHKCLDPTDDVVYTPYRRRFPRWHDFTPWPFRHLDARASCDDLLVLNIPRPTYCICNFRTRKCLTLPIIQKSPGFRFHQFRLGLACQSESYRVAVMSFFQSTGRRECDVEFWVNIFSSETGEWRFSYYVAEIPLEIGFDDLGDAVACGRGRGRGRRRILYFPLLRQQHYFNGNRNTAALRGFVAVDPFRESAGPRSLEPCRLVPLPADFGPDGTMKTRVCVGEVRGRLRVSLCFEGGLRIWELRHGGYDCSVAAWVLVHDVGLAKEDGVERMYVCGFNPNDGDAVFVLCDNDICKYVIGRDGYSKVGDIPDIPEPKCVRDDLPFFFNVFTLLHSPTPSL